MLIARLFLQYAAKRRISAAIVFGDMQKAYYSVLVELVLGPLLMPGEREVVLQSLGMDELRKQTLQCTIEEGHCLFGHLPLPNDLVEVVREWQRLAWFSVQDSDLRFVHNIGVKPGDPAADVLFAFAFYCFHTKLLKTLEEHDLTESVTANGITISPSAHPPSLVPVGAPPYMDDLFIPVSSDNPLALLERVVRVADVLDAVATEFGFTIQYGAGKTEAIIVLRGRGKCCS
jgi:hypothetical protein